MREKKKKKKKKKKTLILLAPSIWKIMIWADLEGHGITTIIKIGKHDDDDDDDDYDDDADDDQWVIYLLPTT